MADLFILRGLPKSGITYLAKDIIRRRPQAVRISKKEIINMVDPNRFKARQRIAKAEKTFAYLIRQYIKSEVDVVVDDYNLDQLEVDKIITMVNMLGANTHIILVDTPVEVCVQRDAQCENPIGEDALLNLAFRYKLTTQVVDYVLFGLDGVLADTKKRLELAELPDGSINEMIYEDPDKFHLDSPIKENIAKLNAEKRNGYEIVICSFRPESSRAETEEWLAINHIEYDRLILKEEDIYLSEPEYKKYVLDNYLDKDHLVYVLEDNKECREMFLNEHCILHPCQYNPFSLPFL